MWVRNNIRVFLKRGNVDVSQYCWKTVVWRNYYSVPFLDLFERTTGQKPTDSYLETIKKKHHSIDSLSHDRLQCTLGILKKFGITAEDACHDPHVFVMNPISMENYGEILKECGFVKINTKHLIRYNTLVKSRTISKLKQESLLREDLNLEERLHKCFKEWSYSKELFENFPDSSTNIVTIRMSVLQKYLNWRIGVTLDEFAKFCRCYLPMRHRPMSDIKKALDIAQNVLKFDAKVIRRNGFIISSDPMNTKFILENVDMLGSLDIREVIRMEPAILKMNYNSILEIRNTLQNYRISEEAQRRCFKVYCMCPETVQERLEELCNMKEYQVLKTNPRVLSMVVHKRKMLNRLEKIQSAKKQCYSLNHLVSSSKVFNNYISNFGNKICGRDLAILINSSLNISPLEIQNKSESTKLVLKKFKRHKFWLHAALKVIDENIQFLKKRVSDEVIFNNCQLLLYPTTEVANYIDHLFSLRARQHRLPNDIYLDATYNNLTFSTISDDQILSLVLYEVEKKYHFSGDGIWSKQDTLKAEAHGS